MKKTLTFFITLIVFSLSSFFILSTFNTLPTGAPPNGEPESAVPDNLDPYAWLRDWVRPVGPPKVALQVGHWKNNELPEELSRIIGNTGASAAGIDEVEVNLAIAEETKKILNAKGIVVDIIPATVPEKYYADAFVAIHADGSDDYTKSGYKSSPPWRDFLGKSTELNTFVANAYQKTTGIEFDDNISRNMRGYYAFSFWRYDHSIHPMTPAIIVETGFLTSAKDRQIIVKQPTLSAEGLALGIIQFLQAEGLLNKS